jgi:excisionase family DNA binding protein
MDGEGAISWSRLGDVMTVAEVASAMRVSTMTVYRLIRSGELHATRIGRGLRVARSDVERYLARGRVGA